MTRTRSGRMEHLTARTRRRRRVHWRDGIFCRIWLGICHFIQHEYNYFYWRRWVCHSGHDRHEDDGATRRAHAEHAEVATEFCRDCAKGWNISNYLHFLKLSYILFFEVNKSKVQKCIFKGSPLVCGGVYFNDSLPGFVALSICEHFNGTEWLPSVSLCHAPKDFKYTFKPQWNKLFRICNFIRNEFKNFIFGLKK